MSEEKRAKRGRIFAITRNYSYDSHPVEGRLAGVSVDDWKKDVEKTIVDAYDTGLIDYMAYIYHDKDKDKQGGIVPIHCHVMVRFHETQEQDAVAALFKSSTRGENCQPSSNNLGTAKYLIHISTSALREEKYIYSIDDVTCINCRYRDLIKDDFWKKAKNEDVSSKKVDKAKAEVIVNELALRIKEGELRKSEALEILEEQAGYYWVRTYRNSFDGDVQLYVESRVKQMTLHGRKNTNIYIMGAGGIGKSNLARKMGARLAGNKGLYTTAPLGLNKTPDALNHYKDEKVAIFNEISPCGWSLDEFLACFDFYEYAPFPSRNENKHFIGDTSIFTNSISPLQFANDLLVYSKGGSQYQDRADKQVLDANNPDALDKYWQARRRFSNMVVLLRSKSDPNVVTAYVFNLQYGVTRADGSFNRDDGNHVYVGTASFECKPNTEPNITDGVLLELERLMAMDVQDKRTDVMTIGEFLEMNGIVREVRDSLMSDFIENVVSQCVWDLLPTEFLYDLYRSFRERFYPTEYLMTVQEFGKKLDVMLIGWERKQYPVRSAGKMDRDEPLITEFNLLNWYNDAYGASNPQKKREFRRKNQYRGFVRI